MTKHFLSRMQEARALVSGRRPGDAASLILGALAGQSPAAPRWKTGATTSTLAKTLETLLPKPSSQARTPAVALSPGAEFQTLRHDGAAGGRAYKLYVPANRPAGPRPLLVMLHGCTQNPDDFAVGTRMNELAEAQGVLVAYPEQTASDNPNRCWNWFDGAHQRSGAGEPAIIAGIVEDIAKAHDVDRTRVFAAGLSAGGAMAAVLGATYPDLFAAIGVHSGLPYRSATDVGSAFAAMRSGRSAGAETTPGAGPRLVVFHGTADKTVHPGNGEALARNAAGPGMRASVKEGMAGGRHYKRTASARPDGRRAVEYWTVEGLGHAWSGGDPRGSHADAQGPDASREMLRFFLEA